MNKHPRITFCTGVDTVTGANFLLETVDGKKILVDCGLIQGDRISMEENREPFPYDPSSIETLIVTHAHLDHIGRIAKLVRDGFHGTIYSTEQTRDLAELILNDAVGILNMEARQERVAPLYGPPEVQAVFPLWETVQYHKEFNIAGDVKVVFKDAGHILGSAMAELTLGEMKILFSGDLGNSPAPLLRDNEPIGDVDYLVMESVYGDRNHEPREERDRKFAQIIKKSISKGGTLVIPAFSVDRTQVLLYELNNLIESKLIPSVPVFVDSPLATKVTQIYQSSSKLFNKKVVAQIKKGDDIFSFPRLEYTVSQNDSRDIDHIKGAKIILAGSGMSIGGRVVGHEEHYLSDPRNTLLLVGYQTIGSLGGKIAAGARKVNIKGREIEIHADIETMYGYSAHKDSDHLLEFVAGATERLKKVFVVMGEPAASMHLAQRINGELGVKAVVPERNMEVGLN